MSVRRWWFDLIDGIKSLMFNFVINNYKHMLSATVEIQSKALAWRWKHLCVWPVNLKRSDAHLLFARQKDCSGFSQLFRPVFFCVGVKIWFLFFIQEVLRHLCHWNKRWTQPCHWLRACVSAYWWRFINIPAATSCPAAEHGWDRLCQKTLRLLVM